VGERGPWGFACRHFRQERCRTCCSNGLDTGTLTGVYRRGEGLIPPAMMGLNARHFTSDDRRRRRGPGDTRSARVGARSRSLHRVQQRRSSESWSAGPHRPPLGVPRQDDSGGADAARRHGRILPQASRRIVWRAQVGAVGRPMAGFSRPWAGRGCGRGISARRRAPSALHTSSGTRIIREEDHGRLKPAPSSMRGLTETAPIGVTSAQLRSPMDPDGSAGPRAPGP